MVTSERRDIKTMEEEMKRVRSNAEGIGAGSLRTSSKDVHVEGVSEGRSPRRANSYQLSTIVIESHRLLLPGLCYLSSKNPSSELFCISILPWCLYVEPYVLKPQKAYLSLKTHCRTLVICYTIYASIDQLITHLRRRHRSCLRLDCPPLYQRTCHGSSSIEYHVKYLPIFFRRFQSCS